MGRKLPRKLRPVMQVAQEATVRSLRKRVVPPWYDDAKLGIFVHWGLSSVPGWAPRDLDIVELFTQRYDEALTHSPYSEWYENAIKFPESPSARHHRETYGNRSYESFREDFAEGLRQWDPDEWARSFAEAGARYVVMVTKHHDGYCLWPSTVRNPHKTGWTTERDCVGDLAEAVCGAGLRFGVYYSGGIDWSFNPEPVRSPGEFLASIPGGAYDGYAEAQVRELIDRYRPDVLWNDIAWPTSQRRLLRLFADYYAAVPEGLVNDRWVTPGFGPKAFKIKMVRSLFDDVARRHFGRPETDLAAPTVGHFDFRTPEYSLFEHVPRRKWESVRGLDKSFGYNRASLEEDFLTEAELLGMLVDIVSCGGNLLLNVGPRGEDATIPEPQERRLGWLADWMQVNGDTIRTTRPWVRTRSVSTEGAEISFTARDNVVFAHLKGLAAGSAGFGPGARSSQTIPLGESDRVRHVELTGFGPLPHEIRKGSLVVTFPSGSLCDAPVHTLELRR